MDSPGIQSRCGFGANLGPYLQGMNSCSKKSVDLFRWISSLSEAPREVIELADLKRAAQKFYPKVAVIARVDTLKALKNVKETCKVADAILLARGDLGAVIAPEKMFRLQKFVLRKAANSYERR